MRLMPTVSLLLLSLGVAHAEYPQASNPKLGERQLRALLAKLPLKHPADSKNTRTDYTLRLALCRSDEVAYEEIARTLVHPFLGAWQSRTDVARFLAADATASGLVPKAPRVVSTRDRITHSHWQSDGTAAQLSSELARFRAQWSNDAQISFDAFEYQISTDARDKNNAFGKLVVKGELQVRGANPQNQRQSERLDVLLDVTRVQGEWRLAGLRVLTGDRVVSSRAPAFTDETKEVGLADVPIYLRREAIRRGGYSAAVTDFNGDGVPDLFFGAGGESVTMQGHKDDKGAVTFKSVTQGMPQGSFVKTSVFADFDNDGDQDAVLVRFVDDHANDDELVFFRNDTGTYKYEPLLKKASLHKRWAMPAAVADFNRDGFLDLYAGYPGKKDFTTLAMSGAPGAPVVGELPHGMFFNQAGKRFTNVTQKMIPNTFEGAGHLYPHSALAFDYDHNGTTDLVVIDDRDNLSPMYRNNGTSFDQVAHKIGLGNSGYGMSVAVGDYNGDGLADIAMTNVVLVGEARFQASCDRNWNIHPHQTADGLRLFKNEGKGRFTEVTATANLGWPGAATGGLTFVDYNNDGFEDLYVANGLWSGTDANVDLDSLWAMASFKSTILPQALKYQQSESQATIMDLLIHHQGHPFAAKTVKGLHPSLGGYQRNKLFRNNGDGTFTDVAFQEGADSIADGYGVVTMDLDRDGKQDLVLRNADPGVAAHKFPAVQFMRNRHESAGHALSLELTSSEGNRDAIGTEVTAIVGNRRVVRELIANNGPQQSERLLHFGLGEATTATLEIKWPNGAVETKRNVAAGFHKFEAPLVKPRLSAH